MKKKEKLVSETENVKPEAETMEPVVQDVPSEAVVEPAVAEPETATQEPANETPVVEEAPAVEESPVAEESAVASEVEATDDAGSKKGAKKEKKKREPKEPKKPKKRKLGAVIVSVVAIVLVAGIAVGGYFLGLFNDILNPAESAKKYFEFAEEQKKYDQTKRVDGEVIDADSKNELLMLKSERLQANNSKSVEIKLVDALTGESLSTWNYTHYFTSSYSEPSYSFDATNYPLVVVKEAQYNSSTGDYSYYYSTGIVKPNEYDYIYANSDKREWNSVTYGSEPVDDVRALYNGMFAITDNGVVSYYDKEGKLLRTENALFEDSYAQNIKYDAEHDSVLYAWEFDDSGLDRRVQLYGTDGMCYAQYTHDATTVQASVNVLNNGDVFIQEWRYTETEDYDFETSGVRIKIADLLMNKTTGAITELDLNMMVIDIASAYAESDAFPFALKDGKNNQALVCKIEDKTLTTKMEYVVFDDTMTALYSMGQEESFVDYEAFGKNHYIKTTMKGGVEQRQVCTAKGTVVFDIPANEVAHTDNWIITSTAIFNANGRKVYNFEKGKHTKGVEYSINVEGNLVFMTKKNQTNDKTETYIFSAKAKNFVLVADGDKTKVSATTDDYYVVYDADLRVYTLFNAGGEVVLKTQNGMQPVAMEDTLYVETTIKTENGQKDVCYIISAKNEK